jgi:hypothetical protein
MLTVMLVSVLRTARISNGNMVSYVLHIVLMACMAITILDFVWYLQVALLIIMRRIIQGLVCVDVMVHLPTRT